MLPSSLAIHTLLSQHSSQLAPVMNLVVEHMRPPTQLRNFGKLSGKAEHAHFAQQVAHLLLMYLFIPETQREHSAAAALPDLQVPHAFAFSQDRFALRL